MLIHFFVFSFWLVFPQEAPQSHDILVFMTGQEEIEALARTCRDIAKHLPDRCGPMVVIPLYASLPPTQQLRVFQPAPKVKLAAPGQTVAVASSSVSCCSQLADRCNCGCCWHCSCLLLFDLIGSVPFAFCSRAAERSSCLPTSPRHLSLSLASNMSLTQGWLRPNVSIQVAIDHHSFCRI